VRSEADPEPIADRIAALDGIRAVAIALVLFFHGGFSWAGGGFFGVDVFFVLSGFLITGLLISEFGRDGRIRLGRFWGHRVRRLVPALLAMLAGVAVYGVAFAPPDTLAQLRGDAVATLLYGNNWHMIAGGTGYFADLNTPRPLLHTWSLSIEEQFYLVWPLVVLGVLKWTRSRAVLLGVAVAGAGASAVAMSVFAGGGNGESRAYYGTDTRAQAVLIGAALAILLAPPVRGRGQGGTRRDVPSGSVGDPEARPGGRAAAGSHPTDRGRSVRLVRTVAPGPAGRLAIVALGGVGLVVIGVMCLRTTSASGWIYHGGFALVALATAAVIASVALIPAGPWSSSLSLRPVRYIGTISYGLYLWHWPVFVVVDHARTGLTGWPLFLVRVAIAGGIAAISFHFLEMPIRRGVLRGWRGWALGPLAVGGMAALMVATTAGATPELGTQEVARAVAVPGAAGASARASATAGAGAVPSGAADVPTVAAGTGGPVRVLLVGDSEASFLGFGLGPGSGAYDVDYQGDGVFGCGLVQGETVFHGTLVTQTTGERGGRASVPCATQLDRWRADVDALHPDVVLLAEGEYEVRNQRFDGRWTHLGDPAFDRAERAAVTGAVDTLRSTGATVVLLTAPYYRQLEQPDGRSWPEDDPRRVDIYNGILRSVAAASGPDVVVEDLNAHLDPGGHFASTVDGVDVRFADGIHVTPAGAALVSPWMLADAAALGRANRISHGIPVDPAPLAASSARHDTPEPAPSGVR
jgi:peptidoglycan/LPS O-acetylase OafA/YrhL